MWFSPLLPFCPKMSPVKRHPTGTLQRRKKVLSLEAFLRHRTEDTYVHVAHFATDQQEESAAATTSYIS